MVGHGLGADEQFFGNVVHARARGQQPEDFELARRQAGQRIGRVLRGRLGVDQREMRLDRVVLSDDGPLTPASIRVACKDIVPGLSICASDHYALHQIFKIEPVNND